MRTPRAILAGVHGHGRRAHLPNLRRLAAAGRLELVGLCDRQPPEEGDGDGVDFDPNLAALIDRTAADLVVLSTPIDTHLELALTALDRGCHLLLEKPPVPDLTGFRTLAGAITRADRACQIGFQSFGSAAVTEARRLVAESLQSAGNGTATGRAAGGGGATGLGEIRGIAAAGAWNRDRAYWTRAPWAGHRLLNGRPVVDGVLTNALAHAVATALHVAGADAPDDVSTVDTHLYRANDIESDDTSSVTVTTATGRRIVISATLCADEFAEPRLVLHGTDATATLWWLRDDLEITPNTSTTASTGNGAGAVTGGVLTAGDDPVPAGEVHYPRTDLLTNLLDHIADPAAHALLAPLESTGAFTRVLEAIRVSPDPVPLPPGDADGSWTEDRAGARRIAGVTAAVLAATDRLAGFADLNWPPSVPTGIRTGESGETRRSRA